MPVGGRPQGSSRPQAAPLPKEYFLRPAVEVARDLLGACLVSEIGKVLVGGRVVETEAYGGAEDPASHAAVRAGRTRRNRSMFGPPGRAYVYRIYGMHWCFNVVVGEEGDPGAVLVRGLEPELGVETMLARRSGRTPLAAGPARLAQALGIAGEVDGHDLSEPPLRLFRGSPVAGVAVSGRIGVTKAADRPHRFFVPGSAGVTPYRPARSGEPNSSEPPK